MNTNPLYWEQGVFLQPQHFQVAQLHQQEALANTVALLSPYLWGVRRLVINETALDNGFFELTELELVDGAEWIFLPGNATLPVRDFREAWPNPEIPLPVSIGLAPFRAHGENVLPSDTPETVPESYRFTAPLMPDRAPDLHSSGPDVNIRTLRYNLRLCFGEEEGRELRRIPVARLVRDGERVRLDRRFAPPCVDIRSVPVLYRLVRDVRDTMVSRSKQLEEYKIIAGETENGEASSLHGITLFSILGVLSRNAPELEQLLNAPGMHPWPVFVALCRLVGELSVFSATLSPLGETPQGDRILPPYDHARLYECFSAATEIISRLVDTLVIGPAFTFLLEPRDGHLGTIMPQNARSNSYAYWLLLRTAHREKLAEHVKTLGKLAPPSALGNVVTRALPGIRLLHTDQPPAGLPRRGDTLYFMIDQTDSLWQEVLRTGEIALILPGQPEDLLAQLTVIQR